MDLSNNLKILSIERLEKISIADLQARIDQKLNISLSRRQAFETYMGWLREQLAMDMFVQEDPILKAWAISLLERGFGKDFILSSFKQWQQQEALVDRSTLRRFLMVEEELSDFLEHPSGGQSRKRKQSPPSDKENDELRFRKGKRQTGANETPVGERRPLGSSWIHHEISKTRSSGLDHLPSWPDHENRTLSSISPTPKETGPSCVAGKKRSNSGIIDIGTPTKKMSRDRHLDDDTPLQAPYPKNNNPGPNNDTLDSIPPHEGYVCNRCGKKGHWVHLCPTNLDPAYDSPPNPDYRCKLCLEKGRHYLCLCPLNKDKSSLTQQRRKAGIRVSTSPARQRRRSPIVLRSSTRARDSSRLDWREKDDFDQRYRGEERSYSPLRRNARNFADERLPRSPGQERSWRSPQRERSRHSRNRERYEQVKDMERRLDTRRRDERVATSSSRRSRSRQGLSSHKRSDRRHLHVDAYPRDHGRLRYEGDDETDAGSTKQPGGRFASKTPQTPSTSIRMGSTTPSSIEVLTRSHTLSTQEAFTSEAIAEVDTFLRNLDNESLEDRVEGACEQEMTSMIEEICGDEDPLLYQNDDGVLCKRVTNPPYGDQVVRLFTHRSNPIIRARTERALASEFWKTQSKFEDMSLDDFGASN